MKRQGFGNQSQLHVELSNYARLHIRQNINMCVCGTMWQFVLRILMIRGGSWVMG